MPVARNTELPRRFAIPRRFRWLFVASLLTATGELTAALPAYLRTALNQFHPDVPSEWAYTLTTERNNQTMVERFDPSQPAAQQWTLLEWSGRAPTPDEKEKYASSRPTGSSGGPRANFQRSDIDPGSLKLLRESDAVAEFEGDFQEAASASDKMLAHLRLRLIVDKTHPHIKSYTLHLKEPYWPVLGVKMNALEVETQYAPPTPLMPSLPTYHSSRFVGRLLIVTHRESLTISYRDFQRVR